MGGLPVLDQSDEGDLAVLKAQIGFEPAAENLRLIHAALTRVGKRRYLIVGSYPGKIGKNMATTESRSPASWRL